MRVLIAIVGGVCCWIYGIEIAVDERKSLGRSVVAVMWLVLGLLDFLLVFERLKPLFK